MSDQLNEMRKLAGLALTENQSSPVSSLINRFADEIGAHVVPAETANRVEIRAFGHQGNLKNLDRGRYIAMYHPIGGGDLLVVDRDNQRVYGFDEDKGWYEVRDPEYDLNFDFDNF